MFVRNAWYVAAWSDEVLDQPFARRILDEAVVLYRPQQSGGLVALRDRCIHRAAPLSRGEIVGDDIQCGYHGLKFDPSGRCVEIPGQSQLPAKAFIKRYTTVEQHGLIWIWMGDERCDPARIPSYPFHDDLANWPHRHDHYHVKANYMLLVDNLMDLSHVGYVHKNTIGGTPSVHMEAEMSTRTTEAGLFFSRWLPGSPPPPTYRKAVPSLPDRVDRWQELEWFAPGVIVQWSGAVPTGQKAYDGGPRTGGVSLRLLHALTPETERSTHYFWSSANGYNQSDPAATETLYQEIGAAFAEDKLIIEQQQARIDDFGEDDLLAIHTDRARIKMRARIQKMLDAETPAKYPSVLRR